MAVTMNKLATVSQDGVNIVFGTLTTDSSHAAGGEDLTISQVGLTRLISIQFGAVGGYVFAWNGSTTDPELDAYESGTADAALNEANAVDFSTLVIPFTAIGI